MTTVIHQQLRRGILLALGMLLGLILGGAAIWQIDFEGTQLSHLWEISNKWLLLLALVLLSLAMPFVALRWRALLDSESRKKAHVGLMTAILCAAFVFNLALPGPVGEGISAAMVRQRCKIPFTTGLASLAVSRIVGLGCACLIAVVVYAAAPFPIPPKWQMLLQGAIAVLCASGLIIASMAWRPGTWKHLIEPWMDRGPAPWRKLMSMAHQLLTALLQTTAVGWRAYTEAAFWTIGGHMLVSLGIYVATLSIGVEAPWAPILFTYAASIAASVAMFMLPGSSIGWDLLFATTLSISANMQLVEAGVVTAVIRVQQILVALAGVAVVWWMARDLLEEAHAAIIQGE